MPQLSILKNEVSRDNLGCVSDDIRVFNRWKNKVLIYRSVGGVGDVLYHRYVISSVKKEYPELQIGVAMLERHLPLLEDHPDLSFMVSVDKFDRNEYAFVVNTTHVAGRYEAARVPNIKKHRAQIWTENFGVFEVFPLSQIRFKEFELESISRSVLDSLRVGIAPFTAHPSKDWPFDRWINLIGIVQHEFGALVEVFHSVNPKIQGVFWKPYTLREWKVAVAKCDIIITPATALFVMSEMLRISTVAVWGCEDLKVYGKYHPYLKGVNRDREKDGLDWSVCPCWDGRNCQLKAPQEYPPVCLESITEEEVMQKLRRAIVEFSTVISKRKIGLRDGSLYGIW